MVIAPSALLLASALAAVCVAAASPQALVTVAQRDPNRSARAPRSSDLSSDGRFVAFESRARLVVADIDNQPDIYVLDRTNGQVTLESGGSEDDECTHPRISGDGRYVVYESRPSSAQQSPRADIALRDRIEGSTRVLSVTARNANDIFGWSRSPDISEDGRVIAFSSAATTLMAGPDVNGSSEDIYLIHLPALTITRASVTASGAQLARGDSILPSLSADGRWLAFASTAALGGESDAAVTASARRPRPLRQVFLRDAVDGTLTRVSRALGGGVPNGDSSLPSISADGRFVAFVSEASNLSPDDGNRAGDVFLFDRELETVSLVSRAAGGSSANGESTAPMIAGNGRFVAFQSDASNLVCARHCSEHGEDINLLWDAFVFDRSAGSIIRVSEDELGGWMEPSAGPAVDGTGLVVAFSSRHPVGGSDRADDFDLFVRSLPAPALVTRKNP
jgi:Tol biopolymer transport system component